MQVPAEHGQRGCGRAHPRPSPGQLQVRPGDPRDHGRQDGRGDAGKVARGIRAPRGEDLPITDFELFLHLFGTFECWKSTSNCCSQNLLSLKYLQSVTAIQFIFITPLSKFKCITKKKN